MAIFWGDENETSAQRAERLARLDEVAPYSLVIRTDSYTGNFERELIAYVFGILDEVQTDIDYGTSYIKAFWNKMSRYECDDYEGYKKYIEKHNSNSALDSISRVENSGDSEVDDILNSIKSIIGVEKKVDEYADLYKNYLCTTYRVVDDWEQDTFYYIDRYDKSSQCDCVVVQLQKPLDEKYEDLIINRIKSFFYDNIYMTIENYDYVCSYGTVKYKDLKAFHLLSLELIDNKKNVVKTYEV